MTAKFAPPLEVHTFAGGFVLGYTQLEQHKRIMIR